MTLLVMITSALSSSTSLLSPVFPIFTLTIFLQIHSAQPLIEKLFEIETCGPPQIQNTMLNQTRNPGESVNFRCQIDMSKCMVAFIDWYHESLDGSPRKKVKSARYGDPHVHEIDRVHQQHEGVYTCVVGNVLGKAEASAYLQVNSGTIGLSNWLKRGCGLQLMLVMVLNLLSYTKYLQLLPR